MNEKGTLTFALQHQPLLLLLYLFVCQRLEAVQHNQDQVAGACCGDDLATTALAIFGTLNDPGQVEHLELCTWICGIVVVQGVDF